MKLSLSENISSLRRASGLIAQMAELFDVSMDALTGFELGGGREEAVSRLRARVHDLEPDALDEAESALRRWPNCFEIAYYAADNYDVRGISSGDDALLRRALELYRSFVTDGLRLGRGISPHRAKPGPGHKRDDALPCHGKHPHLSRRAGKGHRAPKGAQPLPPERGPHRQHPRLGLRGRRGRGALSLHGAARPRRDAHAGGHGLCKRLLQARRLRGRARRARLGAGLLSWPGQARGAELP